MGVGMKAVEDPGHCLPAMREQMPAKTAPLSGLAARRSSAAMPPNIRAIFPGRA